MTTRFYVLAAAYVAAFLGLYVMLMHNGVARPVTQLFPCFPSGELFHDEKMP